MERTYDTLVLQFKYSSLMTMEDKVTLSSSDHDSTSTSAFRQLWENQDFVDVTLATADFKQLKAHKAILASSSQFFREIFLENPHSSPLLFLKDVTFNDLQSILKFIYLGQCEVEKDMFEHFLKIGRALDISGLNEEDFARNPQIPTEEPTINLKEKLEIVDPVIVINDDRLDIEPVQPDKFTEKKVMDEGKQEVTNNYEGLLSDISRSKEVNNVNKKIVFKCQVCDLDFNEKIDLIKHRLIKHKIQKVKQLNCKCDQCDYKCETQIVLNEHKMTTHKGPRFDCEKCGASFLNNGSLTIHKLSKHEGIKFKCDKCDFKTIEKTQLRRHKLSVHDKLLFQCDMCDFKCTQEFKIHEHNKRHQ